jgi:hypothetical protein
MWKIDMGLEMPAWFNPFSPQSSPLAPFKGVLTPSKHATPKKDAGPRHENQETKHLSASASVPAARAAASEKTKTIMSPRRFQLL